MKPKLVGFLAVAALLIGATQAHADQRDSNTGQAAFARLQELIGEWQAPLPNKEVMTNIFRPIAFGTALAHEEWKNGEQLTATVFYVVGSELRADHYCDMGNQLRYVAAPSADASKYHFALRDATNVDTHPRHFKSTTWQLVDANHHVQDWEIASPGKASKVVRMEFTRTASAHAPADSASVVRAHVRALNQANSAALLKLFSADAKVFEPSQNPDRLVGEMSKTLGTHQQRQRFFSQTSSSLPVHVELFDIVWAGDLVVAKIRSSDIPDHSRSDYVLAVYRVRDGLIQDLWHIARAETDPPAVRNEAEDVIHKFADANNRGDVDAFLALFSPRAKNFRNSGDPHQLGDKPSVNMRDEKSRREAYLKMFANGAPAQVQTLGTLALGNMVVARDVATLPTGKVSDGISIYRIENGLIVHDWFIYNQARL